MAIPRQSKRRITFTLDVPASEVLLAGDFTQWTEAPLKLKKNKAGVWKIDVTLPPGRYEYRFLVDGVWTDDPSCPARVPNDCGTENCVRMVECD